MIVVGAAHNGLTAGALLAGAGLSTLVVERRDIVGGCCVTEEIARGCRASTTSYIASMLLPQVIRALDLGAHGLRMVPCEPALQVALEGGEVLAAWNDPARTTAEIARFSARDARAYRALDDERRGLASRLQPLFVEMPPDTRATGVRRWSELLRAGRRLRAMGAGTSRGSPASSPAAWESSPTPASSRTPPSRCCWPTTSTASTAARTRRGRCRGCCSTCSRAGRRRCRASSGT